MSINSDFSQLSASSGTSAASSNVSCASLIHHQVTSTNINNSQDKIISALSKCEESNSQLILRKFVYKHLEAVADDAAVATDNKADVNINKFKQIFRAHEMEKYFALPTQYKQKDDKLTLLGILNVPKSELNHEEKKILKSIVEKNMLKSINSFIKKYEEHGGNLIEVMKNNESTAKQQLLKLNEVESTYWKHKIDEMCNEFRRDISISADLLSEWRRLKYEDIEELNYKKAHSKQLEVQIAEIQAKIAKVNYTLRMLNETPESLEAFKILDRKLDEKLIEVQAEIRNKKSLVKQYHDLQGTEYDDILKKYLDLRTAIKKDERLLNNL